MFKHPAIKENHINPEEFTLRVTLYIYTVYIAYIVITYNKFQPSVKLDEYSGKGCIQSQKAPSCLRPLCQMSSTPFVTLISSTKVSCYVYFTSREAITGIQVRVKMTKAAGPHLADVNNVIFNWSKWAFLKYKEYNVPTSFKTVHTTPVKKIHDHGDYWFCVSHECLICMLVNGLLLSLTLHWLINYLLLCWQLLFLDWDLVHPLHSHKKSNFIFIDQLIINPLYFCF